MNNRAILGIVAIAIFVVMLMMNVAANSSVYSDFKSAQKSGEDVHIVGSWVRKDEIKYDAQKDLFQFYLKDSLNQEALVHYYDPKPANFEQADKIVIIGKYKQDHFQADKILMKCPSKYEEKEIKN